MPNKFQAIYRYQQYYEYQNTGRFFRKCQNTGQQKSQYHVTEKITVKITTYNHIVGCEDQSQFSSRINENNK